MAHAHFFYAMAVTCYLLTREKCLNTASTLILGVFSTRSFAIGARRLYIQYATSLEKERGDLENDVVVRPFVIADANNTHPNSVVVYVYTKDLMGQTGVWVKGVFATSAGVAEFYHHHCPDTYFSHTEYMVPCYMDALVKEPKSCETSGIVIRPCKTCHQVVPMWAMRTMKPFPDLSPAEELESDVVIARMYTGNCTRIKARLEGIEPKVWCTRNCASCRFVEFVDVCVTFAAFLHQINRHVEANLLTDDIASMCFARCS